jgi:hypothetical protein
MVEMMWQNRFFLQVRSKFDRTGLKKKAGEKPLFTGLFSGAQILPDKSKIDRSCLGI